MSDDSAAEDPSLDISDLFSSSPVSAELISNIPQEKRAEFLREIVAFRLEIEQIEQYSGPIPHPSIVERYEGALAGSAHRILSMAEERQAANIVLEKQHQQDRVKVDMTAIQGLIWNARLGMFLIVGFALAIILIGMRIMEQGFSAQGFAMIVGAAGGIIIAYVKSLSHSRSHESEP